MRILTRRDFLGVTGAGAAGMALLAGPGCESGTEKTSVEKTSVNKTNVERALTRHRSSTACRLPLPKISPAWGRSNRHSTA